jgi:hypothetical protein
MNPEQLAKSGTEHAEQMALFAWANKAQTEGFNAAFDMASYSAPFDPTDRTPTATPILGLRFMHAIPNAGARGNKVAASQLKAEGVKAGVADIFLPVPIRLPAPLGMTLPVLYSGLYIELKREKGVPSDVTDQQVEFAKFVTGQGYAWAVAFGWRQGAELIKAYIQCETPTLTPKQVQVLRYLNAV